MLERYLQRPPTSTPHASTPRPLPPPTHTPLPACQPGPCTTARCRRPPPAVQATEFMDLAPIQDSAVLPEGRHKVIDAWWLAIIVLSAPVVPMYVFSGLVCGRTSVRLVLRVLDALPAHRGLFRCSKARLSPHIPPRCDERLPGPTYAHLLRSALLLSEIVERSARVPDLDQVYGNRILSEGHLGCVGTSLARACARVCVRVCVRVCACVCVCGAGGCSRTAAASLTQLPPLCLCLVVLQAGEPGHRGAADPAVHATRRWGSIHGIGDYMSWDRIPVAAAVALPVAAATGHMIGAAAGVAMAASIATWCAVAVPWCGRRVHLRLRVCSCACRISVRVRLGERFPESWLPTPKRLEHLLLVLLCLLPVHADGRLRVCSCAAAPICTAMSRPSPAGAATFSISPGVTSHGLLVPLRTVTL